MPIDEVLAQIKKVLVSGYINEGEQVTELTQKMQETLGAENLILVNSCTSALTLALKLAGVGPGDEVITTPMTCVATNTPILNLGAKVVWADIDPLTGMIDPKDVRKKITSRTKAVMAVAWAGGPPDLASLCEISRDYEFTKQPIKLILDAAHAFGAAYFYEPIHKMADFTCYSFQAIKHVTTGDGGALVCTDKNDYARAKALKWFGLDRDQAKDEKGDWKGQQWDVDVVEAGFKFNMNNLTAAVGLAQIAHIDEILGAHRCNAKLYNELFKDSNLILKPQIDYTNESSCWVYTLQIQDTTISRDELLTRLNNEGIMAGVVHVPNDDYTAFKNSKTDLPGVRKFSSRQLSLPCGWWLTEDDIRFIASRVKELIR